MNKGWFNAALGIAILFSGFEIGRMFGVKFTTTPVVPTTVTT